MDRVITRIGIIVAMLFSIPGLAKADTKSDIMMCFKLETDAARSACVDAALTAANKPTPNGETSQESMDKVLHNLQDQPDEQKISGSQSPSSARACSGKDNNGDWIKARDTSEINDFENHYLSVDAEDPIPGVIGQDVRPTLTLRCLENKSDVVINWDTFLGSDDIGVTYRIDKKSAITDSFLISTNNHASFASSPVAFMKSLFNHEKLVVRLTPYDANPVTATFRVSCVENAIAEIRKACHW